jgi:predicted ATPase
MTDRRQGAPLGPPNRFVVISGCSGGGKSTLLAELARRGHSGVEEPGRRIVAQELAGDGAALPWVDGAAFGRRAIAMALDDLAAAKALPGWVFFDRGLVDAAAGLERGSGEPALRRLGPVRTYHHRMFLAPPWPEIYVTDTERRHGLAEAIAEYDHLAQVYPTLGYDVVVLPRMSVAARADFVLAALAEEPEG